VNGWFGARDRHHRKKILADEFGLNARRERNTVVFVGDS
jgi:hypothetical protein